MWLGQDVGIAGLRLMFGKGQEGKNAVERRLDMCFWTGGGSVWGSQTRKHSDWDGTDCAEFVQSDLFLFSLKSRKFPESGSSTGTVELHPDLFLPRSTGVSQVSTVPSGPHVPRRTATAAAGIGRGPRRRRDSRSDQKSRWKELGT